MLKAILDSLDGLDESLAKLYAEEDGKFILQVEPADGYALENVSGLKTSLQKERNSAKSLSRKLSAFEGIDAEEAREAIEALALSDGKTAEEVKAQVEAIKTKLAEKHAGEIDGMTAQLDALRGQLGNELIKSKALKALAKHGGSADLLMPHIESQTRMDEVDGEYRAVVIDKNGEARISSRSNTTDNMSVEELVESMRDIDTFSPAFTGSGASGNGAKGSSGAGGSAKFTLTAEQAKDAELYRATKEQATKAGSQVTITE